ncbi:caspase family protein [Rhizobium sp. TRM95111]|uniref:caspase family protein n=1 Tax=Rhizobium alarense TaxID=2846851 RepID=UPI001F255BA2|nr:caspase family protein [Rhizobium alarense]MCF3641121.1 caspase family protein [Rhizobium alarense]
MTLLPRFPTLLAAAALAALAAAGLGAAAAQAEDRALVIGVGTYQNLSPKQFLHGPKNDVALIEGLLKGRLGFRPEQIRLLKDEAATKAAILAGVEEWLVAGTSPGDRAYLYFSGHGLQVRDVNGEEQDGMDEAIAPFDIAPGEGDWTNVITDDEIDAITGKLKDRAVTLVVDACHSGTISRAATGQAEIVEGARFLPRFVEKPVEAAKTRGLRIDLAVVDKPEKVKQSGLEAWSAASSYQIAWDDDRIPPEDRNGVFTAAYVAGHDTVSGDNNANGLVSLSELFEFVKKQSQAYCVVKDKCQGLDPQLEVNNAALGGSVTRPPDGEATATQAGDTAVEQVKVENTPQVVVVAVDPVQAIGDILGREETGDVTVTLDRGVQLKNGDVFRITVTSGTGGHLLLFDVNRDGKATQIFPNEAAEKITALSPGAPITIPDDYYGFDFEADGEGESVLVAIVVADPLDLSKLAPASQGLTVELDARPTIADVVGALKKTWTDDAENRGIRWSLGTLKYTIY